MEDINTINIIRRIKDSTGKIIAYTIKYTASTETINITIDNLKGIMKHINNATLLDNGEIEIKPGYEIETVVEEQREPKSHKYIDYNILYDFSESITLDDISEDFDKFNIQNIVNKPGWDYEEYRYYLEETLYDDYISQRANYRSYIEPNMDARILMELRKSALIPMGDEQMIKFYTAHNICETIENIKNLRIKWLRFINDDYMDLNWQLYYLIRVYWGRKAKDIVIDFESYFNDGNFRKQTNPDYYRIDFLRQHIPPESLDWII